MKIKDSVYGEFEINEPVLIEIIESPEIQRLKGISMGGFYPAYPDSSSDLPDNNRYSHSIGVFLLLRKFEAGIEEQIAGLIHDVSHTAFSHTIDYITEDVDGQMKQDFQDNIHEKFIKNSEIDKILKKYGFDINYILNDKNFTLKENDAPNICADRIDYSIRHGYNVHNMLSDADKDYILNSLTTKNNSFIFKDFESAKLFSDFFWELDSENYSGLKSAIMFAISGLLFKYAVKKNYITMDDFLTKSDNEIIEILLEHSKKDIELKKYFEYLNLTKENYEDNPNNYIRGVHCKVRRVDAPFIDKNGEIKKVSDIDADYKNKLSQCKKFKTYYINIK